nr:MAG TPA: hypothetical protein [Caudoviricetes sp.]
MQQTNRDQRNRISAVCAKQKHTDYFGSWCVNK